jgi:plasmid stabilization system protein ParE
MRKEAVLDRCSALKEQPFMGASCDSLGGPASDLRDLICGQRIAFYEVKQDAVCVYRLLDSRQDYLRIIFGEVMNAEDDAEQE